MGGVSGVTGGGGVYQPSESSKDPFSVFQTELTAFLQSPNPETIGALLQTMQSLENSNITPQQKETLQHIQKQLSPYLGRAEYLAYLQTQPQTPENVREEGLLKAVQNQDAGIMLDEAGRLT